MGLELEFKLAVPRASLLEEILSDPAVTRLRQEAYRLLTMSTAYYDTPQKTLQQRRWTLRLRQENGCPVATLKTPGEGRARGEWSCEAPSMEAALEPLLAQGAPAQLAEWTAGQPLRVVCAAEFSRRAANLLFADGTVCELAGDIGELWGGTARESLCEVELELKSGNEQTVAAFAEELKARYGLQEEPRSKFARAVALAEHQ